MNKHLSEGGIVKLSALVGIFMLMAVFAVIGSQNALAADSGNQYCANGTTMTAGEFKVAEAAGKVVSTVINQNGHPVFHVNNTTGCTAPLQAASYKVFVEYPLVGWLSTQQFFASSAVVNINANGITDIPVSIPVCRSQMDLWYQSAPLYFTADSMDGYIGYVLVATTYNPSDFGSALSPLCTIPTPTPTPTPCPPTPTPTPTPTATPTPTPTATPCSNCGGSTTIVTENNVVVVTGSDKNDKDTIELFKTDDRETVKPGEALTYRIVVRNNKDHDLTNVKIQDRLPIYLSPLETKPSASADAKSRTITWDNQTISANSEVTYSLRVRVDQSAPNGFLLQNVAIINGDGIRASASDSTLVQGAVPQIAAATTIQAVPVSAKTGVPFDMVSMLLSFSGTVATAGTLVAKRFI